MKSYKTTALGIATILGAIAAAAVAMLDGDPGTAFSWPTTIAAITAGIGLMAARDNSVTSKSAGAK